MIEAGIYTLMSTNSSIAALCRTRIYPVVLPTAPDYPAVRYQVISNTSNPTLTTSGMQRLLMQFDCFGQNYPDAANLRDAIRQLLNGYRGLLSDGTFLQDAQLKQQMDAFDSDARVFRCMSEFHLLFNFTN